MRYIIHSTLKGPITDEYRLVDTDIELESLEKDELFDTLRQLKPRATFVNQLDAVTFSRASHGGEERLLVLETEYPR